MTRGLALANRLSELAPLRRAVDEIVRGAGGTELDVFEVNVALEEVFANVVRHGFPRGGEHEISVEVGAEGRVFRARVADGGIPFDPLGAPAPDLDAPIEARKIGGLGVFLVKSYMDELVYRREGERNVLALTRELGVRG